MMELFFQTFMLSVTQLLKVKLSRIVRYLFVIVEVTSTCSSTYWLFICFFQLVLANFFHCMNDDHFN